jgi:flagellar biosynthetic protein FlhB
VLLTVGAAAGGAALAGVVQTRALLALTLLTKGVRELAPLRYPSRLRDGATDAALGVVRGVVLISVLTLPVWTLVQSVGVLLEAAPQQVLAALLKVVRWSVLRLVGVVVVFGAISFGWVRWRFTVRNRMSIEELREEYKQEEGDPHIRAARRHEHQALALGDLEQRVRRAKVVVVRRREAAGGVAR